MTVLLSNELFNSVKTELNNATFSVQIITAYCKESSFRILDNCINDKVLEKRLLVRFRLDDIINGSTDFEIIGYAQSVGWKVYIRFDLHAKTYIVDNKRCLIGSANVTNSGFNIGKKGNIEMGSLINIDSEDIDKIENLFSDAILVDDIILKKMKTQLNSIKILDKNKDYNWDRSITKLFRPKIRTLFSYELPEDGSLKENMYLPFLDITYDGDVSKVKRVFRKSNVYLWLIKTLEDNEGYLYFGALSQKLHNAIVTDPKPYRKEVKTMLSNLLEFIEFLNMEEIRIDRPNYSQRIKLIRREK